MVGVKARSILVKAETWAEEFMPYGTPCEEPSEPGNQRIEVLEAEVGELRRQVESLMAERDSVDSAGSAARKSN
jgi:serine O-acetyltransferase